MPYGPTQFQSTIVKPYYKDNSSKPVQDALKDTLKDALEDALKDTLKDILKENYNQYALEGNYDFNIIIIDIPQL